MNKSRQITIEIDGFDIDYFDNFSLNKSIENFCNNFSFTTNSKIINTFSIKQGDKVVIKIADELVFTGNIENISHSQDDNENSYTIGGRDKTGELLDSYAIPKKYRQNNISKLIRLVLDDNGYNNIDVVSEIKILPKLVGNSFIVEKGMKIFEFIDKMAKQCQLILRTDEFGDMILTREGADLAVGTLTLDKTNPNLLNSSLDLDSSETYKYIRIIATQKQENDKKRFKQSAEQEDELANNKKRLIVNIGNNSNRQNLDKVANWYMAVKRGKGARYTTQVAGFLTNITSGLIWQPNSILLLKDKENQINGAFLIQGVEYNQSLDNGSTTSLAICNIGSFSNFNDNPILSAKISKFFKLSTGDLMNKFR